MSSGLFKAIELWSAPGADGDDEHDPSALTVLRLPQIDDQGNPSILCAIVLLDHDSHLALAEAIAIGSYNGLLKIYLPDKGQFYSSQVPCAFPLDLQYRAQWLVDLLLCSFSSRLSSSKQF